MAIDLNWQPTPAQIRLLADRLCWLEHGQEGLRWRQGLWDADKAYLDKYDRQAEELAPRVLRPHIPFQPAELEQMTLF